MTPTADRCTCCGQTLLTILAGTSVAICVKCDALALWPDKVGGR